MDIHTDIQKAIKDNRLVVFVGSGLSTRFNLPNWNKLTEEVIGELDIAEYKQLIPVLKAGLFSPIEILDKLKREHTKVRSYIQNKFKLDKGSDLGLHKKILEVTGSIITTNYDNAFEEASLNSIIPTKFTSSFNISEINKSDKPYIFKLHGCYSEPDNCIIFTDDYRKLYEGDTATKTKLKSIFIDKTILFVGFSFSDPDINLIFSSLDKIFDNHNQHFVLTTSNNYFDRYKFLKQIIIQDYTADIPTFFDACLSIKSEESISNQEAVVKHPQNELKNPKIAFLKPKPLDYVLDLELSQIETCFDDLEVDIFSGYLNTRTLESIDDYDMLIIATKTFKDRLYIEDDNLKSDLLSPQEICDHIPNDKIPIIFITNEKIELCKNYNTINISTYKRAVIKRFTYKALRNKNFDFKSDEEISIGLSNFNHLEIKRGNSKKRSIYSNDRMLDIGEKSLKNIVGRIEEQSTIISRIHTIMRTGKILNIKASGGTGKTTLIKKVSYELYNRGYFKEGVSFQSCENVKCYEDFEEIVSEAFGLRNIINLKDYLVENYSTHKLDKLIILDNFETVSNSLIEIDNSQTVNLIKFIADYANVIITSREKVYDLEDYEELFSLTTLTTDDALALFELDYGKIESEEELVILRQDILEELLNNNPLAIKLVTKSRTMFMHIEELRDQIKKNFFESLNEDFSSVFKNKADLNIERTKSIYQSINYSYTTLNNKEKIAFELLSLFPDGISLSNFKKCFEESTSTNNISDKELRVLRDKSLVEDYNGTLQLQPILRRFAEFQFSKRQVDAKQKYCLDAYIFNCHILDLLDIIDRKKNSSDALKVYSLFKNNLLNVFSYIPDIQILENSPVPEKKYLLNYIYVIQSYVMSEKQISEFYDKINLTSEYFKDLAHAETFLAAIKLRKKYYHQEFERSYRKLSAIFPPKDLANRNFEKEEFIEKLYKNIISSIHDMEGHTLDLLTAYVFNENYSRYLDSSFFYLGLSGLNYNMKSGFYFFEFELMFNRLNISKLENYIKSLYLEENLEIMQSTYTLSKVKKLEKKDIKKLVVTNPYTKGLQNLMFAFISESNEEKLELFKSALADLSHIKYYYLEALYFYCKYLKESENQDYEVNISLGLELSQKYYYQFIHHQFTNLSSGKDNVYNFSYEFYPIDKLEEYMLVYKEKWEKYFKEETNINR